MATAKLAVTGMHCDHCEMKVTKALQGVAGVFAATVAWRDGAAEVDYQDGAVTTDELVAAVQRAGYQATVAA